jgi:hypothetical protein
MVLTEGNGGRDAWAASGARCAEVRNRSEVIRSVRPSHSTSYPCPKAALGHSVRSLEMGLKKKRLCADVNR